MTLQQFFKDNKKVALAFSGGVDSAYLLYAGLKYGCDVVAYYVKSEFQPQFELEDAKKLAKELGAKFKIIEISVLDREDIRNNGPKRCYFCKKMIFENIMKAAANDGYTILIDGTNASDPEGDRPGMQAIKELSVRSPLKECGLIKDEIRRLSKEAGLFTWNKSAYACLATRTETGTVITKKDLEITEKAEKELSDMGFSDFRIRMRGETGLVQVRQEEYEKARVKEDIICQRLEGYYKTVTIDTEVRS